MIHVSIVLPTFNERGNICNLIEKIHRCFPPEYNYELVVVDDDSPDGTYNLVKHSYECDVRVVPVLRTSDRGFAKSIYEGIKRSRGDLLVIMDTDLTHDPLEIPNLLHVSKKYDVVSASRFCSGGKMTNKFHYISSFIYNIALRLILRTQVQDNLGGYFVARRSHILELACEQIFIGYGEYYFRLLFALKKAGRSIVEIPAIYISRSHGHSKSKWLKMVFDYGYAALKFRFSCKNFSVTSK